MHKIQYKDNIIEIIKKMNREQNLKKIIQMKNFKNYLLITICSLMSFVAGLTIHEAKASINEMHLGVHHQTVYVDGEKYIVFTSSSSSMAVVKK